MNKTKVGMFVLTLSALIATACVEPNVEDKTLKVESIGAEFVLERKANVSGNTIYVVIDKKTGNTIYLTPGSGVYVPPKED